MCTADYQWLPSQRNHRCLDSKVLRIVTVECMRSIVDCELPVRLTFVCKVTDIFTEMNIVCVGHFTKSPSFRLKTYAFPVIECFQGYCDI